MRIASSKEVTGQFNSRRKIWGMAMDEKINHHLNLIWRFKIFLNVIIGISKENV
jgi:hypothetical protein